LSRPKTSLHLVVTNPGIGLQFKVCLVLKQVYI
jgi:hypothetical protein